MKDKFSIKKLNVLVLLTLPIFICSIIGIYLRRTVTGGGFFDFSYLELFEYFVWISVALIIANFILFKVLAKNNVLSDGLLKFQFLSLFFFGIIYLAACFFLRDVWPNDSGLDNYYTLAFFMPLIILLPMSLFGLILNSFLSVNDSARRQLVQVITALLALVLLVSISAYYLQIQEYRVWMCLSRNMCNVWPF